MDRRNFLKTLALTRGTVFTTKSAKGTENETNTEEFNAILVDTTMCEGCRSCEEACAEAHGKPVPDCRRVYTSGFTAYHSITR